MNEQQKNTSSFRLHEASTPTDIERASMAIIEAEAPTPRPFSGRAWIVARRLVHTSADFDILNTLHFHPDAVTRGVEAIRNGATLITDTEMARAGMTRRRLDPFGVRVVCFMSDPEVAEVARMEGITRARAAMDRAMALPGPKIIAIGNAPTALLRLLECVDAGAPPPELVVGMPVGFVNAAESKDLLMASTLSFITVAGRKGGSNLAAAAINALAEMALEDAGLTG
ncbi:precorrin-8X methylmutase [Desulfovibrio inopinatus]|uniref:precorrin-8X methylmutase n=1 Tax=Desulfovibrio inopinatus TaxID=102109 RepID=UPI000428EFCD|nr:precorrin-8X methylmutase [Desulfovibrio inopinatus]